MSESGDGGGNGTRGRGERVKGEGIKGHELGARQAEVKDRGARTEWGGGDEVKWEREAGARGAGVGGGGRKAGARGRASARGRFPSPAPPPFPSPTSATTASSQPPSLSRSHRPRAGERPGWPRPELLTWRWRCNSQLARLLRRRRRRKRKRRWHSGFRTPMTGPGVGVRDGGGPDRAGGRSRHCGTDGGSGGGGGGCTGGGTTQTRTLIGQLPSASAPPSPHATTPIGRPKPASPPYSSLLYQ